jgi:regulator of sigma E protease
MNFIFAILVFALIFATVGQPNLRAPTIGSVTANSVAERAGLRAGDTIIEVDGRAIRTFEELQRIVQSSAGKTLSLVVRRGEETVSLQATPVARRITDVTGPRVVGILGMTDTGRVIVVRYGPIDALAEAGRVTWQIVATTAVYVANIFTGKVSGEHIAGPLGILKMSGDTTTQAIKQENAPAGAVAVQVLLRLVTLAAFLSVAVGIANLLPIPILDGWHLLLYGIEAIRGGRPVPLKVQEWAVPVGLLALALLFLFATSNDIRRFLG